MPGLAQLHLFIRFCMPVGTHATVEEWERNGKFRASFRNLVMGGGGGGREAKQT